MKSTEMRVSPQCDTTPDDDQWQSEEEGCPQFSDEKGISADHPDIIEAIEFLNNTRPEHLIAYSRGAAVALLALASSQHSPSVTFVAPAWKRGWVEGIESPSYPNGVIIHGTADDKVPLSHSVELSMMTGMELYVFDGRGHIDILKHKNDPQSGRLLSQEEKEVLIKNETTT
jgi:alpha-beta hydrolase superfamily lysophospholipase